MPEANPNLVVPRFYLHTTQDMAATEKAGRPIFKSLEVCELRYAGNKQTIGVYPAHETFKIDRSNGQATPITYALAFQDQYLKFKAGEAQEVTGTPLSEAPFLSQAKRLELKALNIHTVEALAALDGNPLRMLGMGGRELKDQASAYLEKAAGTADVTALAKENTVLREQLDAQAAELAEIKAMMKKFDRDGDGRPGGSAPSQAAPVTQEPVTAEASPFEEWADDDIKNWLKENGAPARGFPAHKTLVKLADELNARLKKAAA